jgi:sarcosine oxidase subunit gamma
VGEAAVGGLRTVDVSHNRVILRVRDRNALAAGCGLDLDPDRFRPGHCAQTLLARAQVILEAQGEEVLVYVRPSFAHYLEVWLGRAVL